MNNFNRNLSRNLIIVSLAAGVLCWANWGYKTTLIAIACIWAFLQPMSFKLLVNIILILFGSAILAAALRAAAISEYLLFLIVFIIVLSIISEISSYVSKKTV